MDMIKRLLGVRLTVGDLYGHKIMKRHIEASIATNMSNSAIYK